MTEGRSDFAWVMNFMKFGHEDRLQTLITAIFVIVEVFILLWKFVIIVIIIIIIIIVTFSCIWDSYDGTETVLYNVCKHEIKDIFSFYILLFRLGKWPWKLCSFIRWVSIFFGHSWWGITFFDTVCKITPTPPLVDT